MGEVLGVGTWVAVGEGLGLICGRPRCTGSGSNSGCSGSMWAGLSLSTEIVSFFPLTSTVKVLSPDWSDMVS